MPLARPVAWRAAFALIVAVGFFGAAAGAGAAPPAKRALIVALGVTPGSDFNFDMFRRGLGEAGIADAQVQITNEHAHGDPARLPAATAAVLAAKPDVILARGPAALAAAARATTSVPVVAVDLESDPLALGYAKTLARPGGNITGVFLDLPEISAKQLQLLREVIPDLAGVALVGDSQTNAAQFRVTEHAARTLGIHVESFEGRTAAQFEAALESARRARVGAVVVFSSPVVFFNRARIATVAREKRLPTVSLFTEFAEAGGLFTYGPSVRESFRRSGVYAARILSGAKPAELPIERPERFELVINMKTAAALGVTIPHATRLRADQLLE